MAFNKNELVLDRVRSATYSNLTTGELVFRLTSIEDPSLNFTSESEEVTNALGTLITKIPRAKSINFSGTNSLVSFDLMAAQFGTEKETASAGNAITSWNYEILTVANGKVQLSKTAAVADSVPYIYSIVDGDVGTSYAAGASASATEFLFGENGEITVPTALANGSKVYVEYAYTTEEGNKVTDRADDFPTAGKLTLYVYYRDKCTDELLSGVVLIPKAKLSPDFEQNLTSTGKHPFEFDILADYCNEDNMELVEYIVTP